MTRPLSIVAAAAWLALAPLPVSAQAPVLTYEDALRTALAGNPSVAGVRAGSTAAAEGLNAAKAAWWPRVSVRESWQRGDQPVFVFSSLLASRRFAADNFAIAALNQPDPSNYFHTLASIEQVVFDGGVRRSAVASASTGREIADLSTREIQLQIAQQVTASYGRVLSLQSMRLALGAAVEASREDLARVIRRRDAGLATEADVLALTVQVADFEQRLLQADGELAAQRAELNRLMAAPIENEYRVEAPPDGTAGTPTPAVAALFAEAEGARPEILKARAAERLAGDDQRRARAALLPTVAAQAALDVSGLRPMNRASSWLVGGELRWTLSTGGAERAHVRAAAASGVRARAATADARAAVQVEIVAAARRLDAARARQTVGRAAVEQAHESQRIVRDRYEAGLLPVNDMLRASAAVLDAEARRVDALVDTFTSAAALERAVGRLP